MALQTVILQVAGLLIAFGGAFVCFMGIVEFVGVLRRMFVLRQPGERVTF